jgi:hypothetical protein
MSERRAFLKTASLIPLGAFSSAAPGQNVNSPVLPTLTKPPAPQEQPIGGFDIHGTPDPNANLLGQTRPADWGDTKSKLGSALTAAVSANDPVAKWVNVFMTSFADRAAKVVLDTVPLLGLQPGVNNLTYEPALYDSLLRSAASQLDRCLQLRNEMGSFEISGVTAGINYLAFLKLKPIQHNLLVQSSVSDIAKLQKASEDRSSQIYKQASQASTVSSESLHMLGLQSDADGSSAESDYTAQQDILRQSLLLKQFQIQTDMQLAQFTRLTTPGSSSNYAERYLRLFSFLEEDLSDAYNKLYSVSLGIRSLLFIRAVTVGVGATAGSILPAFADRPSLDQWVGQVILNQDQARKPDILDALVIWCRGVMREIDKLSQYETEFTVAIPLTQPTGKLQNPLIDFQSLANYLNGSTPGPLVFTLTQDALTFPSSVLYRARVLGVGLSIVHSPDDASPVQYSMNFKNAPPHPVAAVNTVPQFDQVPPAVQAGSVMDYEAPKLARFNAIVTPPKQSIPDGSISGLSYSRPSFMLTNIRIQGGNGGDLEPTISYDPSCRNLMMVGTWAINLDPHAVEFWSSQPAINIANMVRGLILHLRVRGTTMK